MAYYENYKEFFESNSDIEIGGRTHDIEDVYRHFKQRMLAEITVDSSDIFQKISLKDATMQSKDLSHNEQKSS